MAELKQDFETALQAVINDLNAPKAQRNTFGNYNFRSAEDIIEAVKPLLKANNLRMKISDTIELVGDRTYVKATVTVNGYGESDEASAFAREPESKKGMDEAQITGATSSYARKYALNGMFDIDDTKDPDTDEHSKQAGGNSSEPKQKWTASSTKPATDQQKSFVANLLRQHGYEGEDQKTYLVDQYGLAFNEDGTLIITQADAQMIIDDHNTKGL